MSTVWYVFPKEVCSRAGVSHERLCFHTQKFLHTSYFYARKCLNTKKMCTDTFPDRNVYAQKFVHTHKCLRTEFFTHRTFYTHKFLHAQFFAHISFYKLNLHCTQGNFYTEKSFTQRIYTKKSLYTKKPLRTKTVTRKSFYTEVFTHIGPHKVYTGKLWHRDQPGHRSALWQLQNQFYFIFWRAIIMSCGIVASEVSN